MERWASAVRGSCWRHSWILVASSSASSAKAAQQWRNKQLYFGDAHWHSCLSQDASATLSAQYESMIFDYGLDFSLQSEHAEGAEAGILACGTELPPVIVSGFPAPYSGEQIANAMKLAADLHTGELLVTSGGTVHFVAFTGYGGARLPSGTSDPLGSDSNAATTRPDTSILLRRDSGWTYHDDVWAPGDGPSDLCGGVSGAGWGYYNGSKDWVDEILGQLIHQRDDPQRAYDLFIQYNHPAASTDKGGDSNHLAKWLDHEHSSEQCDVVQGSNACVQNQCETMRGPTGDRGRGTTTRNRDR